MMSLPGRATLALVRFVIYFQMALKNTKNTRFFATRKISNNYMSSYSVYAIGLLKYLLSSTYMCSAKF